MRTKMPCDFYITGKKYDNSVHLSADTPSAIFQEGSYDYNSNATQHPWYFCTTPFNYRILDHTEHRKKELGFPEWFNCSLKIEEQLKTQES